MQKKEIYIYVAFISIDSFVILLEFFVVSWSSHCTHLQQQQVARTGQSCEKEQNHHGGAAQSFHKNIGHQITEIFHKTVNMGKHFFVFL